jgi:hypothetical protein
MIAGSCCYAFSKMGSNLQLCDDSVIPFEAWLREVKLRMPDMFMHECAGQTEVLFERMVSKLGDRFQLQRHILCPSNFGFPTTRSRSFVIGVNRVTLTNAASHIPCPIATFGRVVMVDGSIYFCAEEDRARLQLENRFLASIR